MASLKCRKPWTSPGACTTPPPAGHRFQAAGREDGPSGAERVPCTRQTRTPPSTPRESAGVCVCVCVEGRGGGSGSCSVGSGVRVQGIQGEVQQSISASSIPQAKRRRGAMRSRGGPVGDARTPSPRVTGTAASPLLPKPCAPAAGLGPSSLGSPGTDGTHRSSLHPPLSTGRCGPRKDIAPTHLPTHPPTARCFQGTRFYFGPSFEVRVGL